MQNTINIKASLIILLEYFLALLIILDCNSVYVNNINSNIIGSSTIFIIFSLIILQLKINKFKLKNYIFLICLLTIYFIIFIFNNVTSELLFSFISKFFVILFLITLLFLVYSENGKGLRLFYCISNIMTFLGAVSICFWLLCSVFKVLPLNNIVYINWGGYHNINGFYDIYYETQPINFFGYNGYRNTGIFTEAPMFNLCLSIALLFEFFLRERLNLKKIAILSMTIITTFSTTGYIVLMMCIGAQVIKNRNSNTKYMRVIKILFIMLTILISSGILYYLIIDKMATDSFYVRIGKYISEFNIWKENVLFGSGYGNNEAGSSNSLMVILADGGVWLFVIYIIAILEFILYRKNTNGIYFGVVFLFLFIVTVFPYSLVMYTVLGLGYKMIISKESIEFK